MSYYQTDWYSGILAQLITAVQIQCGVL